MVAGQLEKRLPCGYANAQSSARGTVYGQWDYSGGKKGTATLATGAQLAGMGYSPMANGYYKTWTMEGSDLSTLQPTYAIPSEYYDAKVFNSDFLSDFNNLLLGTAGLIYSIGEYGIKSNAANMINKTRQYLGTEFNAIRGVTGLSNFFKAAGRFSFYGGMLISGGQGIVSLYQHDYGKTAKSSLDIGMGIWGFVGSIPGLTVGTMYWGMDTFYPGGWNGAM